MPGKNDDPPAAPTRPVGRADPEGSCEEGREHLVRGGTSGL